MASNTRTSVLPFGTTSPYSNFEFNLPPHNWSLPLDANKLDILPGKTRSSFSNNHLGAGHKERRGKIWRYASLNPFQDSNPVSTNPYIADEHRLNKKEKEELKLLKEKQALDVLRKSRDYGFQFLWNPTEYATSTAVSQNVVPAATDSLSFLNLFQGTGTVNFSLQINRINDFACFGRADAVGENFDRFYGSRYTQGVETTNNLINDLRRRGTLADIEYLYKTINGGFIKNAAGIDTADIGIIVPTLVRVDIGPYSQVGIVNNINVSHKMFTQTMIPIVSEVSLGIQILSSYGFGLNQALNKDTPPPKYTGKNLPVPAGGVMGFPGRGRG
jgi:hypothetical protein